MKAPVVSRVEMEIMKGGHISVTLFVKLLVYHLQVCHFYNFYNSFDRKIFIRGVQEHAEI